MTRRHRHQVFLLAAAGVVVAATALAGCSGEPVDVLTQGPSDTAAGEFAILAATTYGKAVSRGPDALDGIPGTDCWECSPETQVLLFSLSMGASVEGGEFIDLVVASTAQQQDGLYQVELDGRREDSVCSTSTAARSASRRAGRRT